MSTRHIRQFQTAVFALLLMFCASVWAQVAALGSGDANTAQNNNSLAFTVPAGSSRVLIVAVETIGDPSGVTFNGQALTEIGGMDAGSGIRGELWGIALGTGGSISGTIQASGFNTTNSWNVVAAQAFEKVNQATPWDGFTSTTTGSGDSSSSINVTSEAGDLVFDALLAQGNGNPMTATVGAGQMVSFNETTGNGLGAGSYEGGAATTTMSWDFTNFFAGVHLGVNLNEGLEADLAITKDGPASVVAGTQFDYTITVTNNGPDDATGVTVTDTLPVGLSDLDLSSGCLNDPFGYATCPLGTILNGASAQYTLTVVADSGLADGAELTNTVLISGLNEVDPNPDNDSTSEITTVTREVDITLTKTESVETVVAGSGDNNLTYVVTATNNGPSDVTDLVISESMTLPPNVTLDSVTASAGNWDGGAGEWTVSIPANSSETLTVIIDVPLSAAEGTDVISNTAAVESSGGGETFINTGDDSVTESTSIRWPEADFAVSKEYTDGDGGPVEVTLTCTDTSGLLVYAPQVDTTPTTLTVRRFDLTGAGTDCTVTEEVPDGFAEFSRTAGCDVDPVADQGDYSCTITNGPARATFEVTKEYMDGNDADDVTLAISCNTGLPIEQMITVGPGSAAEVGPGQYAVEFVVVSYDDGELTCTVTEEPAAGYTGTYDCEGNANTTCDVGDPSSLDAFFEGPCVFENVTADLENGAMMQCDIRNYPDPVDVVINKDWVFEGTADGEGIDLRYDLTLFCDGEIVGGQPIGGEATVETPAGDNGPGCGIIFKPLQESPQGFESADWCKVFEGEGPMDAEHIGEVIPNFPTSSCYVVENVEDGAVEVESTCGSASSPFQVSAGQGAECTVTNTVFFEGIPTLSQYGMAIMALLMLGIGLVGFRRYG